MSYERGDCKKEEEVKRELEEEEEEMERETQKKKEWLRMEKNF